jgi:hypothetical protein
VQVEVDHGGVQQTGTQQWQEREKECAAEKEMEREAAIRKEKVYKARTRTAQTHGLMSPDDTSIFFLLACLPQLAPLHTETKKSTSHPELGGNYRFEYSCYNH